MYIYIYTYIYIYIFILITETFHCSRNGNESHKENEVLQQNWRTWLVMNHTYPPQTGCLALSWTSLSAAQLWMLLSWIYQQTLSNTAPLSHSVKWMMLMYDMSGSIYQLWYWQTLMFRNNVLTMCTYCTLQMISLQCNTFLVIWLIMYSEIIKSLFRHSTAPEDCLSCWIQDTNKTESSKLLI